MSTKTMFEPIQVQKEEKKTVSLADIQKYRILPSDEIPKPDVVLFRNIIQFKNSIVIRFWVLVFFHTQIYYLILYTQIFKHKKTIIF